MSEELTAIENEQLNKIFVIESKIDKSDDGKWAIQNTLITSIKPIKYFKEMKSVTKAWMVSCEKRHVKDVKLTESGLYI